MTPSERERTDACWCDDRTLSVCNDDCARIRELPLLRERAELAEAAARDFAKALELIAAVRGPLIEADPATLGYGFEKIATDVLARHPSFSGEEGTEG